RWATLSAIVFLVSGCDAKPAQNGERTVAASAPAIEQDLMGRWIWVRSSGGWLAKTINPHTQRAAYSIQFGPSGKYVERRDGQALFISRYRVEPGFAFATEDRPVVVVRTDSTVFFDMFSPAQGHPIDRLSADTLVLFDEGSDGWWHVFVRWRDPTAGRARR
ncbi:MAG: hypothetical protein P8174_08070, partial [Gemmatimonadota bacterium]